MVWLSSGKRLISNNFTWNTWSYDKKSSKYKVNRTVTEWSLALLIQKIIKNACSRRESFCCRLKLSFHYYRLPFLTHTNYNILTSSVDNLLAMTSEKYRVSPIVFRKGRSLDFCCCIYERFYLKLTSTFWETYFHIFDTPRRFWINVLSIQSHNIKKSPFFYFILPLIADPSLNRILSSIKAYYIRKRPIYSL